MGRLLFHGVGMNEEKLKLALEALEYIHEGANNQGPHTGISWRCVSNKAEPAITALRQALANEALDKMAENARMLGLDYEPAQKKPVAWFKHGPYEDGEPLSVVFEDPNDDVCYSPLGFIDNTSPQPAPVAKPHEQEPYGWIGNNSGAFIKNTGQKNVTGKPLYTSPPAQRTWVGLTDKEIEKLTVELRDIPVTLAFAIEAKLKEKNT